MTWNKKRGEGARTEVSEESTKIRLELWATAAEWSPSQLTWLSLGYDPGRAENSEISAELEQQFYSRQAEINLVLDLARTPKSDTRWLSPRAAIDQLRRGEIDHPKALAEAVVRGSSGVKPETSKSGQTKKINTLQKLLLIMAVDAYDHKPPSSSAAQVISRKIQTYGMSMDAGTIRTHLEEAFGDLEQEEKDNLLGR